jgi:hypothetical protein
MGEVDHLARGGHSSEQAKGLFRSKIVERLHDVVGEKRGGSVSPREFVIPGYTERQIQLESCAFGQFGSDLGAPVGSLGDQEFIPVRRLGNELRIIARTGTGYCPEDGSKADLTSWLSAAGRRAVKRNETLDNVLSRMAYRSERLRQGSFRSRRKTQHRVTTCRPHVLCCNLLLPMRFSVRGGVLG